MDRKKNKKLLNWIFIIELALFGLIITSVLPREAALYLGAALVLYVLVASLDDTLVFFVRSIPLFLALPLMANFDNFNIWRVLAAIIFLKWFYVHKFKNYGLRITDYFKIKAISKSTYLLIILLLLAILSLVPAPDKIAATKRIIFFLNFAILGIVIYYKAADQEFAKRLIRNSVIPVIIVAVVGYIQVISTYFIDIYQFMRIWGEGIQCRQFGEQWCNIAVWVGNTWFAYFGEQLSLRVFSLFPDSHSFPQFVLLGIPAVFAITQKRWVRTISLSLLFLIVILSGTRGIWAASVGVVLLALGISFYIKRCTIKMSRDSFMVHQRLAKYLILFFVMFVIAFPIFSSPQFLMGKDDSEILKNRIKSILDFGETSNAQRIEIWKKTLISIKEKPLLGVGIGNYPVVLAQDIRLAKAGSSAHNLYLHIAAEIGLAAGIMFIWLLWLLFRKNFELFVRENDKQLGVYFAATLLYVPWVLIYSLTDVAILDERAFLMFVMTMAIILGINSKTAH